MLSVSHISHMLNQWNNMDEDLQSKRMAIAVE